MELQIHFRLNNHARVFTYEELVSSFLLTFKTFQEITFFLFSLKKRERFLFYQKQSTYLKTQTYIDPFNKISNSSEGDR